MYTFEEKVHYNTGIPELALLKVKFFGYLRCV